MSETSDRLNKTCGVTAAKPHDGLATRKTLCPSCDCESTVRQSIRKVFGSPVVDARAGNIKIVSDDHGMGFTLEVDGQPIKGLRPSRCEWPSTNPTP